MRQWKQTHSGQSGLSWVEGWRGVQKHVSPLSHPLGPQGWVEFEPVGTLGTHLKNRYLCPELTCAKGIL